jgi:hypothetical protein
MESTGVNYLAVFAAGLVYTILAALWYSPMVMGKAWLKATGKTEEQEKAESAPWKMFVALVGSWLAAYGIARILSWTSFEPVWGGMMIGLLVSVCFLFTVIGTSDMMEGRPLALFRINILFNILGFMLMGLIIGLCCK